MTLTDYDDENELIRVTVTNQFKKEYVYDGKMRMRIRKEFSWNGSGWMETNEIHYIWDGNVLLQTRNSNNVPVLTFTRGQDLSDSLQGAGGIGGLLAMTESSGVSSYYHSDGNGNVTTLINSYQILVAKYLYGPFGDPLSEGGPKAFVNPIWFSSELYEPDTGFSHFPRRVYVPSLQRWLSRDPIQELGGINLYLFVDNDPLNKFDLLGLTDYTVNEKWLNAEYQQQYNRLKYRETWQTVVPIIGEAYFDTTFWTVPRNDTFTFNGATYTSGEINYIGIGMYEAHSGDSMQTALTWVYLWKELKWPWLTVTPNDNELYWLQQGYNAYLQRQRCDQPVQITGSPSFGITYNTPVVYFSP